MARQPWYVALSRYRWYVSIGAGAGVMALASGVILIRPRQPPTAMMNGCGLMPCKATPGAPQRGHATAVATPGRSVSAGGDSLILSPPSAGTVLAPGASLTVVFTAWGLAASPLTCTVDGAPC